MSLYSRLELGITIIQYSHLFYHKYSYIEIINALVVYTQVSSYIISMTQAKRVHMRVLLKLKAKLLSGKYNYRAKDHKSTTGHFYTAKRLSNLSTSTGLTFNM